MCFSAAKRIRWYGVVTFSIIFGLFISIIPNVLNESCKMMLDIKTAVSILTCLLGFGLSYYLGNIEGNNAKIKNIIKYSSRKRIGAEGNE